MADDSQNDSLANASADYVASALKSVLGAVPFAGSLLSELAGNIVPNQRIERISHFASELEARIRHLEMDSLKKVLHDEHFADLLEESAQMAVRSVSQERRQYIAELVANSLTSTQIEHWESKHLLRLLGELNDVEVIWLRYHLDPIMGSDREFRTRHHSILDPVRAHLGSPPEEHEKKALQDSYSEHLQQLGLISKHFVVDRKSKQIEVDSFGRLKESGYRITRLGKLLLKQVGLTIPEAAG